MFSFLIKRGFHTVFVVLAVTVIVFTIIHTAPGDPVLLMLGDQATGEAADILREQLGFNRPLVHQYFDWLGGLLRGDFGKGLRDGLPVFPTLLSRLPATMLLLGAAIVVAVIVGLPLGALSAVHRNGVFDTATRVAALFGMSMPSFWVGVVLIFFFAYKLPWLPASGYGTLRHVVLPSVALGMATAALVMRLARSSMLEVLRNDYIRTARAKGAPEWVVIGRHGLRNGLMPVITVVGLQLGYLLGGSIAVETVFSWPGLGQFTYQRLMQRDYPMIMGSLFFYAVLFAIINLLTDVVYAWVDPRIRYD